MQLSQNGLAIEENTSAGFKEAVTDSWEAIHPSIRELLGVGVRGFTCKEDYFAKEGVSPAVARADLSLREPYLRGLYDKQKNEIVIFEQFPDPMSRIHFKRREGAFSEDHKFWPLSMVKNAVHHEAAHILIRLGHITESKAFKEIYRDSYGMSRETTREEAYRTSPDEVVVNTWAEEMFPLVGEALLEFNVPQYPQKLVEWVRNTMPSAKDGFTTGRHLIPTDDEVGSVVKQHSDPVAERVPLISAYEETGSVAERLSDPVAERGPLSRFFGRLQAQSSDPKWGLLANLPALICVHDHPVKAVALTVMTWALILIAASTEEPKPMPAEDKNPSLANLIERVEKKWASAPHSDMPA